MRDRFGSPRELPSGRGGVFGPFILAPAAGGQACTLSWYAKLPDWAVPPFDAGLRERALFELVAALTKAEAIADVARALSSLPDSCGLVHHPASASDRNGHIEFVPPIGANDLARILGWRDAVGKTFDMHRQDWVVCIVTGQGEFRLETTSPTIGNWVVSATLDRRPTGGEWKRSPPVSSAFGLPWQSDAYLFGPTDVVRFLNFRVPVR
jgi:hypothetical protein